MRLFFYLLFALIGFSQSAPQPEASWSSLFKVPPKAEVTQPVAIQNGPGGSSGFAGPEGNTGAYSSPVQDGDYATYIRKNSVPISESGLDVNTSESLDPIVINFKPSFTPESVFGKKDFETFLDYGGLSPGPEGMGIDAAGVIYYMIDGQWMNAGLTAAAFVPFLGQAPGAYKIALKLEQAAEAAKAAGGKAVEAAGELASNVAGKTVTDFAVVAANATGAVVNTASNAANTVFNAAGEVASRTANATGGAIQRAENAVGRAVNEAIVRSANSNGQPISVFNQFSPLTEYDPSLYGIVSVPFTVGQNYPKGARLELADRIPITVGETRIIDNDYGRSFMHQYKLDNGGEIWTSSGIITTTDILTHNNSLFPTQSQAFGRVINNITGAHGGPDGIIYPDIDVLRASIDYLGETQKPSNIFGNIKGYTVSNYDFANLAQDPEKFYDVLTDKNITVTGLCFGEPCVTEVLERLDDSSKAVKARIARIARIARAAASAEK